MGQVQMMRSTALFIVSSCWVCVMFVSASQRTGPSKCRIDEAARHMTCMKFIPNDVPPHINSFAIRELNDTRSIGEFSKQYFEWPHVTHIHFKDSNISNEYIFRLANKGRAHLVIERCRLWDFVKIYGVGIGKIIIQDSILTSNASPNGHYRVAYLMTGASTLQLENITCCSRFLILRPIYCQVLNILNVSSSISLFSASSYRYLNFTASVNVVTEFLKGFTDDPNRGSREMSRLMSLDISDGNISPVEIPAKIIDPNSTAYFPVLREFYARKVTSLPCIVYVQKYYFMSCIQVNILEEFDHFFIGCFDPTTVTLVDLAKNKIETIDASFVNAFIAVQILDISSNDLHAVKGGIDLDLKRMTGLKEIYLANNQLRSLAADIFCNLHHLSIVDLSNNQLESIMFKIGHLLKLQNLRLDANNIKFIDSSSLTQISSLISYQNVSAYRSFQLDLSGNQMTCSCSIKPFITWVLHNKPTMKVWPLYCHLRGKVKRIDASVLPIASEMCHWPTYVIISCILSTISLSIVIACAVYCFLRWRNSQKEKRIRKLIDNFNNANDRQGFPVFLSFCSNNADFVMANVFDELNNRLQDLLGTQQRCVAFGDADFRPGFIVIEEMTRCLSVCDVVVLCVSNTFLKSPWCADETRIAHHLRKPVMLMFLEEVDKKLLEKSIVLLYFLTSCRAKWILKTDGSYELQPGWGTVCEAVITLLSETRGDHSEEETAV